MHLKRYFFVCSLLLVTILPANSAEVNLVDNGNFEHIKNGASVGWNNTKPETDLISVDFPVEDKRGHIAQVNLLQSGSKGAYFSQTIKVEPHSRYRLSLLAKMNEGKITVAVSGGDGDNKLQQRLLGQTQTRLTMFPLFWDEGWSKYLVFEANQWRPVTLEFDTKDLSVVYVSFGAYFTKGRYSFDDVSLVKINK